MTSPRKILVVDDETHIQELLRVLFEREGHEVIIAGTAKSFLEQARKHEPDLIVLDIDLQGDYGPEAYSQLIHEGYDRNKPLIYLTGMVSEDETSLASGSRKFALLDKSYGIQKIREQVECLLEAG